MKKVLIILLIATGCKAVNGVNQIYSYYEHLCNSNYSEIQNFLSENFKKYTYPQIFIDYLKLREKTKGKVITYRMVDYQRKTYNDKNYHIYIFRVERLKGTTSEKIVLVRENGSFKIEYMEFF